MKKITLLLSALAFGLAAQAQVSITSGNLTYTQNLNALDTASATNSSNLPLGWSIFEYGTAAATVNNNQYKGGNGSSTTGDTYSLGTLGSLERALGSLASNALSTQYGVKFTNNTGAAITGFTISYKGEQWRMGSTGRTNTDSLRFLYSTTATNVSDTASGLWTENLSLMFNTPNMAATGGILDGNLTANSTTKTGTVNVTIPANGSIVIKWVDVNIVGSDDALAVDDINITFTGAGGPVNYRPNVTALTPANAATTVAAGSNLQITFDRQVTGRATGSIYIKNETDQTTVTKAGNNADVTVAGNTVTIANAGLAIGKSYHVTFDSLAFDTASNKSYGIYDTTAWHFSVPTPNFRPTITPVYPSDNATSLPATAAATLRMRFSRRVTKGAAGNITIKNETDQTLVTKAISSADVTLNSNGDTAFIANVALVAGKTYHVLVDSVAFDTAGNYVVGITDTTRWNFSVQGPVVTVTSLNEQFETGCATNQLPVGWSQVSISGSATWRCNTTPTNYALSMNGGGTTGSTANEDWLITPRLNLVGQTNPMLAFRGKYRFAGQDMQVKYSTDYSGAGDPNLANWSDIQGISFTTADSNKFVTKNASLSAAQLFVAFKYISTTATPSDGREWSVDSVMVYTTTTGINTVNSQNNTLGVQVLGTATNGNVMVGFDLVNSETVKAEIYDLAGREVFIGTYNAVKGSNKLNLQPQTLQSGMYIIRISSGKEQGIARTFVQ